MTDLFKLKGPWRNLTPDRVYTKNFTSWELETSEVGHDLSVYSISKVGNPKIGNCFVIVSWISLGLICAYCLSSVSHHGGPGFHSSTTPCRHWGLLFSSICNHVCSKLDKAISSQAKPIPPVIMLTLHWTQSRLSASLLSGGPKLNARIQMCSNKCQVKWNNDCPSFIFYDSVDTAQYALKSPLLLGHTGRPDLWNSFKG